MSLISRPTIRVTLAVAATCVAIPAVGASSASAASTATFSNAGLSVDGFPLRSSSTKKGLPGGKKKGPSVIGGGVFAFPLRSS